MRIGFFTNTYYPICYGSVISIESFRKNLEKLGHEVFIFAPSHNGYKDDNKNVFRYPSFVFKYKIDYPVSIPISSFINEKISELNLDIIHVHQPFSLGREGLRYAKKLKIPVVFTYHARYEDYVHYVPFFPENLLAELVKKEAVNFSNKCDITIAPSRGIERIIRERGVKKNLTRVLATGVNWNFFQKGDRDKIRKKYCIEKNEILCLNIGRMNKEKNLQLLFESMKKVISKNVKVKMMFIGEGFLKNKLTKEARKYGLEDKFIFTGFIEYNQIRDYLHAADVYLQASRSETQGITILEAMAVGLPIIAVKATGTEDFIMDGENGFLVKSEKKAFADKVNFLIRNFTNIKKISRQAKNDSSNYDELNQSKKLELIYLDLLK